MGLVLRWVLAAVLAINVGGWCSVLAWAIFWGGASIIGLFVALAVFVVFAAVGVSLVQRVVLPDRVLPTEYLGEWGRTGWWRISSSG